MIESWDAAIESTERAMESMERQMDRYQKQYEDEIKNLRTKVADLEMRLKRVSPCCDGTGYADYAAVPCPDPKCPVPRTMVF